jgi:AraC-like DNA-binding protein
VGEALARVGLSEELLRDPDERIPEEVLDALWNACRDAADDEAFGIMTGLDHETGSLGVVEYVVRNSATLGDAMEAGFRFQRVLHDAAADHLTVEGDRALLHARLSSGREPSGVLVDYAFARAMAAAMVLTGVPGRPIEVQFAHAKPKHAGPWERTFHCPLHFGASENVLVFRRERLDAKVVGSDPELLSVLEQHALHLLAQARPQNTFVARVRDLIGAELTGGTPAAAHIASKLHMSPRTLSRRLEDEGTSFSTLLDDLRRELAIGHLSERGLSVSEVAFLLGFSDTNAFSRAFKRWTGGAPSRYKRAASGD